MNKSLDGQDAEVIYPMEAGSPVRWTEEELLQRMNSVRDQHGIWTAHNVLLPYGVRPLGQAPTYDDWKLRQIQQLVLDVSPKPIADLSILDLGCLEGLYAVDFARRGAKVVAIEGRSHNAAKVRFAREAWNLSTLTVLEEDVRGLSIETHGTFDVVLCLGILYHLDAPDIFQFVRRISEVCKSLVIIDTHFSRAAGRCEKFDGMDYYGSTYVEHNRSSTLEERSNAHWSSLDNATSFWFTKSSLLSFLQAEGFSTVCECLIPDVPGRPSDRWTLAAWRGRSLPEPR